MKTMAKLLGTFALAALVGFLVISCDSDTPDPAGPPPPPAGMVGVWWMYTQAPEFQEFEIMADGKFIMKGYTGTISVSGNQFRVYLNADGEKMVSAGHWNFGSDDPESGILELTDVSPDGLGIGLLGGIWEKR